MGRILSRTTRPSCWEFRVLQRAIRDSSNMEFALYLVARLRELVSDGR